MNERFLYSGVIEALTLDEVAVKLRMTRDWVEQNYDGPRIKFGKLVRVSAKHLDQWLDEQAGIKPQSTSEKSQGGPNVDVA